MQWPRPEPWLWSPPRQASPGAGAVVQPKPLLHERNVPVDPEDSRQLDFVASGLAGMSVPTCADVTVVATLHGDGSPWRDADTTDGAVFEQAYLRKAVKYPELAVDNPHGKLTVLACEIGGRWCPTSLEEVRKLVNARCQRVPPLLRRSARAAWHRRWWARLSVGLQDAVACCLSDQGDRASGNAGMSPSLSELLELPLSLPPAASRLPLR